jgi:8-oxo-dGTP diphosphatase
MTARQHQHQIAAALIRQGEDILLVQQQGPDNPAPFWALPGGRVEPGELLPEALAREVREETGLEVRAIGRLLYLCQHYNLTAYSWSGETLPASGAISTAFIFEVLDWQGDLCPADPDAFIITCRFLPLAEAINYLEAAPWRVMTEPLLAYLRGEAAPGASWFYRAQPAGSDALIARLG